MSDGRPVELTNHIEGTSEKNDTLIIDALALLEDPKKRGKRKATVATICGITGLSRNTVRNRDWALDRLDAIKLKIKSGSDEPAVDASAVARVEITPDMLRARIKRILEQNVLLYEEVLALQNLIVRKDSEISALKARNNLSIVPRTDGATE